MIFWRTHRTENAKYFYGINQTNCGNIPGSELIHKVRIHPLIAAQSRSAGPSQTNFQHVYATSVSKERKKFPGFLDPYQKSTNCVHVSASEKRKTVVQFINTNEPRETGDLAWQQTNMMMYRRGEHGRYL